MAWLSPRRPTHSPTRSVRQSPGARFSEARKGTGGGGGWVGGQGCWTGPPVSGPLAARSRQRPALLLLPVGPEPPAPSARFSARCLRPPSKAAVGRIEGRRSPDPAQGSRKESGRGWDPAARLTRHLSSPESRGPPNSGTRLK